MSAFDQAIERLKNELFALANKIEDLISKNEEATINPYLGFLARPKSPEQNVRSSNSARWNVKGG